MDFFGGAGGVVECGVGVFYCFLGAQNCKILLNSTGQSVSSHKEHCQKTII